MLILKKFFIHIILTMGLSSIFVVAMDGKFAPIMMGDITTFVPYVKGNELQTLKNVYKPNDIVRVKVDAALSGDQDWVGVYPKNAVSNWSNVIAWNWIPNNGIFALSEIKKSMPVGAYEARLFFHNNYESKASYEFSVTDNNQYIYGQMGDSDVHVSEYSQDSRAVVYHPSTWSTTPTPVVFFAPGWNNTTHASYETLLRFIASHGFSVIYMPDSGSYISQLEKFDNIVTEFLNKFNVTKIGVLGHSAGGGFAFKLLEHMIANGYGVQGRFMMSLDGYFAQYMDKANMHNLANTNVVLMQFGPSGNSTDPRVVLTNYRLLTGAGIDKNYIVLANDNDHGYPARQNIDTMQGMLKPLDALMQYTFVQTLQTHHAMALEGEGKVDPYANGYQKVLPIDYYNEHNRYSCEYANSWHKGSDTVSASDIDNCGEPEIQPN